MLIPNENVLDGRYISAFPSYPEKIVLLGNIPLLAVTNKELSAEK